MFNYKHYVPVLRWKAAEKEALEKITDEEKELITPLIEIIMPQPPEYKVKEGDIERIKTTEELLNESIEIMKIKIPEIPKEILKFWGTSPLLIDLSLIDASLRGSGLTQIIELGKKLNLCLIPVVNLSSNLDLKQVAKYYAKKYGQGLCLRLFCSDFQKESFANEIRNFLIEYELQEGSIDIIVDFQITDSKCLEIKKYVEQVPGIIKWRTFTVISGIFPKDLSEYSVDLHPLERLDWKYWLNQVQSNSLARNPSFGDYTIQHPIYTEPSPGANPSASIRYTAKEKWLIMRGLALRGEIKGVKSPGHAQYPLLARLLTEQPEFFGANFSYGDQYIAEIADIKTKKTGNPRTWLRAGISHHLACVVSQLANLS